jgi:hypothetical protein
MNGMLDIANVHWHGNEKNANDEYDEYDEWHACHVDEELVIGMPMLSLSLAMCIGMAMTSMPMMSRMNGMLLKNLSLALLMLSLSVA